jgi:hypothetical protein
MIGSMALIDRRATAVGVAFLANGVAVASFLARLPERQDDLDLSDGALGVVLVGLALGALAVSPLAAALIARLGSGQTVVASACVLGATLPLAAVAASGGQLFGVLLVVGAADATLDIAMNANGAAHQAEVGRSVMHRLHATWAVGALVAAGVAALAARAGVPLTAHLAAVGATMAVATLAVRRHLPTDGGPDPARTPTARPRAGLGALRPIAALCVAMVGVAVVESASGSWAAVRLTDLGASDAVAALGLGAFTAGMITARLVGDPLTDRWGTGPALRVGLAVAAAGYGLSAVVTQPAPFIAAMAIAGIGCSGCFPLLFGAAAQAPGLAPGSGIATASLAARTGFLVQPAVIGLVADHAGLRPAFAGVAAVAVALAGAATRVLPGGEPPANVG